MVRTSCCFALQIRDGKQHSHTIAAHRHTDTSAQKTFKRTHSHKWTQECTLKHSMMQLLSSGACTERSSIPVNPWLWGSMFVMPQSSQRSECICPSTPPVLVCVGSYRKYFLLGMRPFTKVNVYPLTMSWSFRERKSNRLLILQTVTRLKMKEDCMA